MDKILTFGTVWCILKYLFKVLWSLLEYFWVRLSSHTLVTLEIIIGFKQVQKVSSDNFNLRSLQVNFCAGIRCTLSSFSTIIKVSAWNWRCLIKEAFGSLDFKIETSVKFKHLLNHNVWKLLKMSHLDFEFWHFSPIFVLLKLTCLVTLFDRKLQIFKNSPKLAIFGNLNILLSTQNVNVARFARKNEIFSVIFKHREACS